MAITYTPSMEVALAIKATMDVLVTEDDEESLHVEAYSNGREQGLHIHGDGGSASFSENRNSDNIVVYVARPCFRLVGGPAFDMGGNIPANDDVWDNRRYFHWMEIAQAARFILSMVLNGDTCYGYEAERARYTLKTV